MTLAQIRDDSVTGDVSMSDCTGCTDHRSALWVARLLANHSADMSDFTADHGDHPTYPMGVVLTWLGY